MTGNNVYSKLYFAIITVENDWGYHLETLWYGADARNLASMVMEVMGSWYLPNKDKMGPDIVNFYNKLEEAVIDKKETNSPVEISFGELTGQMFNSNGLRLEITTTNNLMDMFTFVGNETFNIFATNGEKADDFKGLSDFIDHLDKTYDIDPPIINALKNPNEGTIMEALYAIDFIHGYSQRHYRSGKGE